MGAEHTIFYKAIFLRQIFYDHPIVIKMMQLILFIVFFKSKAGP